jgi:hypothetical protein
MELGAGSSFKKEVCNFLLDVIRRQLTNFYKFRTIFERVGDSLRIQGFELKTEELQRDEIQQVERMLKVLMTT